MVSAIDWPHQRIISELDNRSTEPSQTKMQREKMKRKKKQHTTFMNSGAISEGIQTCKLNIRSRIKNYPNTKLI